MKKNIIIIILLWLLLFTSSMIILNKNEQVYTAIGKIESDSDYCLTDSEIKAIENASLTDEYKNYLIESDIRKYEAVKNNPQIKYANCR